LEERPKNTLEQYIQKAQAIDDRLFRAGGGETHDFQAEGLLSRIENLLLQIM